MEGTFGAHPGHDGHILGTLSAIQILVIQDAIDRAEIDRIVECTFPPLSLIYQAEGSSPSFAGSA